MGSFANCVAGITNDPCPGPIENGPRMSIKSQNDDVIKKKINIMGLKIKKL